MIVTADNPIRADVGDFVTLSSDTGSVMKAVAAVYLVPMVLFFAGYALGAALGWSGGLMGGLGFFLGVAFAGWFDRTPPKRAKQYTPLRAMPPDRDMPDRRGRIWLRV